MQVAHLGSPPSHFDLRLRPGDGQYSVVDWDLHMDCLHGIQAAATHLRLPRGSAFDAAAGFGDTEEAEDAPLDCMRLDAGTPEVADMSLT